MADDYQLGICSGVWWNPTRRGGDFNSSAAMSTTSAFSCDEPAGSASGSSITYQDAPHHHMITNQLVDSTMQHPMFTLSPSTMDWNQSLQSSGRAETSTNFHAMLQDDIISMNQSFLLDQHNMSSSLYGPAPTELQQSSSLSNKFPNQYLKPSSPTMQQSTHHQLQFANNTHFWNASAAASGEVIRSGFYPPMPAQFTSQPIEQKPRCSNLTSKGVKEYLTGSSTTKNSSRSNEPTLKKTRIETPSPLPTFKVRKEKLGDRITALQQLVSPFGKTDTASVLHEAIEYIKFLHDQVSVLSTPYLKNGHTMQHQKEAEGPNHDLRSRGLCLVPIESTYPMASENPADFWTPTFGGTYR